jgi:hypothetical protein
MYAQQNGVYRLVHMFRKRHLHVPSSPTWVVDGQGVTTIELNIRGI